MENDVQHDDNHEIATDTATIEICRHCREPLNPSATVCRFCGRRRPRTSEEIQKLIMISGAIAVIAIAIGAITWSVAVSNHHERVIRRIVACAKLHGDKTTTEDFVRYELNDGRQPGVSWDIAANWMLLSNGCTPENE